MHFIGCHEDIFVKLGEENIWIINWSYKNSIWTRGTWDSIFNSCSKSRMDLIWGTKRYYLFSLCRMPWDSGHTSPTQNHTDCSRNLSFSYSPRYWQSFVDFILCGLNDKSVCLKLISIFLWWGKRWSNRKGGLHNHLAESEITEELEGRWKVSTWHRTRARRGVQREAAALGRSPLSS